MNIGDIRRRLTAHEPRVLPSAAFEASVAMVLRPSGKGPEALFIERSKKPQDPWSGQMAFPGGRHDETDRDLRHTAERETIEEVGLSLEGARLIGRLDDQTGQRAGQGRQLRIAAFVYEVAPGAGNDLVPNYEVAEAFWVPLAWFEEPSRVIDYRHPPYPEVSFPGVVVGDPERHVVWGLTFRFLCAFFEILQRPFAANGRR
ncbi:MAG: CoA pyrophosphatase [Acidobacteria bacterium]|nr:CoA pyrophosphatase [Acidobacteriota bacterium]